MNLMKSWTPLSVSIVVLTFGSFVLFSFIVVWYVVSSAIPPGWILTLGGVGFGVINFALGGVLTAVHGDSVTNKVLSTAQEGFANGALVATASGPLNTKEKNDKQTTV